MDSKAEQKKIDKLLTQLTGKTRPKLKLTSDLLGGKIRPMPVASPDSNSGLTLKAQEKVYTGIQILGLGQMHKSNLVPITSREAAIEVATMRRN